MPIKIHRYRFNLKCYLISVMYLLSINSLASNTSTDRENFNIDYLSSKDGLSQSEVTSIVQDKYGFLWFGTRGGVNKYDGYEFKHLKPSSPINGMISPSTEVMLMDNSNNLWVGTKSGGLCRYNLSTEKFHENDTILRKLPNRITALYQDFDSNIWIGTWQNGVYKYNPINNKLDHFLNEQRVSSITQTSDSTMWFGIGNWLAYLKKGKYELERIRLKTDFYEVTEMTENVNDSCLWLVGWNTGLIQFNYSNFKVEIHELSNLNILNNSTYSIHLDEKENLYVGTWGKGLYYYDTKTKISETIDLSNVKNRFPTPNLNVILDISKDNDGNLWIGTDGSGAVKLSGTKQFHSISTSKYSQIGEMHVNVVLEDNKGRLWIGTRENGLFVTSDLLNFIKVKTKELNQDVLIVRAIHQDDQGIIWIGSTGQYNNLLLVEEIGNGEFLLIKPPYFSNDIHTDRLKKITSIFSDNNKIYFGTQQAGLFVFNKKDYGLEFANWFHRDDEHKTFQDNRITSIKPDSYGNIWISTYKGLYLMNNEQKTPVNCFDLFDVKDKITCDIVLCCWPDNKGKIWFGTPCNINFIEYKSDIKNLKSFNKEDGLLDEYVNAIIGVDDNIWFSTNSGISKLNTNTKVIHNFKANQGIGDYNFSEGAVVNGKNGYIYFGGYSDLTYFKPADIKLNLDIPEIEFTSFKILNKEVSVDEDGFLPITINDIEHLTINHKQKEFSFSLSVLDYTNPGSNKYGYRLIAHKDTGNWIYTGSRRDISFSNLKPGDYILQFIGSNSNNIWNNDGKKIAIKVLPPPWKSWYAIILYLCILIFILYIINRVTVKEERLKSLAKVEHLNRLKDQEINEYKLRFFTDITHEIKTPITLIKAPVKELFDKGYDNISASFFENRIKLIYNNTIRLSNLLTQLLEFRKVETGNAVLKASPDNIVAFIKSVSETFENHAKTLNVNYSRKFHAKNITLYFDPFKLDVVISNLLVNAFKFCSSINGEVSISLKDQLEYVSIEVCNNGSKISDSDVDQLFNRFYQGSNKGNRMGSGIGLFLVKKYVDIHGGEITVKTNPESQTSFSIKLLKGKNHLKPENIIEEETGYTVVQNELPVINDLPESFGTFPKGVLHSTILIIDDNEEMNKYLQNIFKAHFIVHSEKNGLEGFKKAIEIQPDLIISDIVMPGADGFELCARLKTNEITKHIPVMLLTARENHNDDLKSIQKGADAYLKKPFDPATLFEKCKQLIATRVILKEKYTKRVVLDSTNKEITSNEEKIIAKSIAIIEKHVDKNYLSSEFLAQEIGMSPSTFYRRIKKATGKSPGELIKQTRLKLAARYLKESNITVSEVIENVGYNDHKHFRDNFKELFGMLPDEYRKT